MRRIYNKIIDHTYKVIVKKGIGYRDIRENEVNLT